MRHPNIVEVVAFGLGDADHPPCLVMERMSESLFDLLGVEGIEMGPAAKVSIARDVCEVCYATSLLRVSASLPAGVAGCVQLCQAWDKL